MSLRWVSHLYNLPCVSVPFRYCFGSFLLQDIFFKSPRICFWGTKYDVYRESVVYLIALYIVTPGPAMIRTQVSYDHRRFERNLSNCEQKPEKVRTSTGFGPVISRYRCDALTNWAMKPLTFLGAGHLWVLMSPWRMDVKWHEMFSYTGIARSRVQTPLKSWLFQASVRNCLNCVYNCDDHSSLDMQYCSLVAFLNNIAPLGLSSS